MKRLRSVLARIAAFGRVLRIFKRLRDLEAVVVSIGSCPLCGVLLYKHSPAVCKEHGPNEDDSTPVYVCKFDRAQYRQEIKRRRRKAG